MSAWSVSITEINYIYIREFNSPNNISFQILQVKIEKITSRTHISLLDFIIIYLY